MTLKGSRKVEICRSEIGAVGTWHSRFLLRQVSPSMFSSLYHRKLLELGWSKEYINQMVKEKAMSESESIYGTLYGTLGEDSQQENM